MIKFHKEHEMFELATKNTSYLFGVGKNSQHLYWGKRIHAEDCSDYFGTKIYNVYDNDVMHERDEFGFFNGEAFVESCIKADFGNTRKLMMEYKGFDTETTENGAERLILRYKNSFSELYVDLIYDVYYEHDMISRRAIITNNDSREIILESAQSAAITIPKMDSYRLRYSAGRWCAEGRIRDVMLNEGTFTIQARRGQTGPDFAPAFAIDNGSSNETSGEVWYGILAYSGNWKIDVAKTVFNNVRIVGGVNNFDFARRLKDGQSFVTPEMYIGFSTGGYGEMSRNLHDFEREYIFPSNDVGRVLYNSWEATGENVNVENQIALADKAKKMGIEMFVVDAGWFSDVFDARTALGDWNVNPEKFPNGMGELIDHVKGLGMDFGIWVEPEAISPNSKLYEAHPDWAYRFEGVEPTLMINQYVLNITIPEAKAYVKDFMFKLLKKNPGISFVKWDHNRSYTDVSAGLGTIGDKELWHNHITALYEIWSDIRCEFPDVELETCAGGGGRVDLGMMRFADQCWTSDNTDPNDRLYIQEGFSYFYSPQIMVAWVTDAGVGSVKYRFLSSMQGRLGIGSNIRELDQAGIDEYAKYIAEYKEIRETVQHGKLYRLRSAREGVLSATQYVSVDGNKIVVFAFPHDNVFWDELPLLKLQGLDPNAVYACEKTGKTVHGDVLMNIGVELSLGYNYDSEILRFRLLDLF